VQERNGGVIRNAWHLPLAAMLRQPAATIGLGPVMPVAPEKGFVRRLQNPDLFVPDATNVKRVQPVVDRHSEAQAWLLFTPVGEAAIASPAISTPL